jgi:hypothetical protein
LSGGCSRRGRVVLRRRIVSRIWMGGWQTIRVWLHLLRRLSQIRSWWVGIAWMLRVLGLSAKDLKPFQCRGVDNLQDSDEEEDKHYAAPVAMVEEDMVLLPLDPDTVLDGWGLEEDTNCDHP